MNKSNHLARRVAPAVRRRLQRRLFAESLETRCMLNADFQLLRDINATSRNEGSAPADFVALGNQVFFTAETQTAGRELWVSDGSSAGTHMLRDFAVGTRDSAISNLVPYNNRLYFIANSQLVASDGTDAGTIVFEEFNAALPPSEINNVIVFQGELYFAAKKYNANGSLPSTRSLWKSDGTPEGTSMLPVAGNPTSLTVMGGQLFFNSGQTLWATDGTSAGTTQISPTGMLRPRDLTVAEIFDGVSTEERLFFTAEDGVHGNELWISDGTPAGTTMVKDIQLENNASLRNISDLMGFEGALYFSANDGVNGQELWRSDGTEQGTTIVSDINVNGDAKPAWLTVHQGSLFFTANDGSHGVELWK
ncbi:MAG: hypothetical protein KDB23_22840, partial [Planctomycetales bacterium]|nr:hypothetical protein [Planctomycetales bacterium]